MNRFSDLPKDQLELLIEQFKGGQYYLLLGSGVSLDSTGDGRTMRSASTLRNDLASLNTLSASASLQQSYSLLSPDQIDEEITRHYTCTNAGQTIQALASHQWRRVYTFNVDNCLEFSIRSEANRRHRDPNSILESRNFVDDYTDISPELSFSIIHLHGLVEQPKSGYVFSHQEYAKAMMRANSWMLTLTQLMRSEPFIVAGTSLDEIDVSFYLEQRSPLQIRNDEGPSVLVEPYPNKLTERLCERHGLWLFEGTAHEFLAKLDALAGGAPSPWDTPAPVDGHLIALTRPEQLRFASTFERVPRNAKPDKDAGKFLLGAPLSWEMVAAKADIPRQATSTVRSKIIATLKDADTRMLIVVDEPGSGKTAIIKRLAFDLSKIYNTVYWFSGQPFIEEEDASVIFDLIIEDVVVFVDNWADSQSYIKRVVGNLKKRNILFVGAERSYRRPYIEQGIADENYIIVSDLLPITKQEARRLISKHDEEGLSSVGVVEGPAMQRRIAELVGEPISVAVCRIQNNFRPFDKIVGELLKATSPEAKRVYVTAAIARFCYSAGVRRRVLIAATDNAVDASALEDAGALPLARSGKNSSFLAPRRSVVADRVVSMLVKSDRPFVVDVFVSLAKALAPYVNRTEISARSPEALLAGRLMDFDQVIRRLINDDAEFFYDEIRSEWSWNSRYWEQVALLKLDRYLVDQSDEELLQAAIQHARHAYAIERHPLSLTTLAKVLFSAMPTSTSDLATIFDEAWLLMNESIAIESRWDTMRATAFVVCFNGVISYVNLGGLLNGDQADKLRDMIATTYARKLHDKRLDDIRSQVSEIVNAKVRS